MKTKAIEHSALQNFNLMKEAIICCPAFLIALTINFEGMLFDWFATFIVLAGKGLAAVFASMISRFLVEEIGEIKRSWNNRKTNRK